MPTYAGMEEAPSASVRKLECGCTERWTGIPARWVRFWTSDCEEHRGR